MKKMEDSYQQAFEARKEKLIKQKDFLYKLNQIIPWSEFREDLEQIYQKERKSNAGRKPIDVILMFKMVILQQLYNLSDEELEYQVNDRLSFLDFLGMGLEELVPDRTTVWLFKEKLVLAGLAEKLFVKLEKYISEQGYRAKEGQIVDATMIPVPKPRNSKEENEEIKKGKIPEKWAENPHKLSQKDIEARWTKKGNKTYYGYKNHINVDVKYKLIRKYEVTSASVHDSQKLDELLDFNNEGKQIWGDSAYRSKETEENLGSQKLESEIHEKATRNSPLTTEQKENNRAKSKIRARVEHIFATMTQMGGSKIIRSIGIARVKMHLGLRNLTYNMKRFVFLKSQPQDNCLQNAKK
jgi:IS5 family transposase